MNLRYNQLTLMRILVISDIHANFNALESVLAAAGEVNAVWCLGDLVGYGPDPNECVDRVRQLPNLQCVLGNHDAAVIGHIQSETFNLEARLSIDWISDVMSEDNMVFLKSLPEQVQVGKVTLSHGSPRNPIWEYVLDTYTAKLNINALGTPLGLIGHTHLPLAYFEIDASQPIRWKLLKPNETVYINSRFLLNPGSVGQPRDHDARASYAIYYPEENIWEARRANYDISGVQLRITQLGLPTRNALRLGEGW